MYFPKNKIKTGLQSDGDLVFKSTKKEYFGPYFKTYDGKFYAGSTPNYANLVELEQTPLTFSDINSENLKNNASEDEDLRFSVGNFDYSTQLNLKQNAPIPRPPEPYYSQPSPQDYRNGSYIRYYAKRTNYTEYIEIDSETYNGLKSESPFLLWPLYDCLYMVYSLNSSQTNLESAREIERKYKWGGFTSYLKLTNSPSITPPNQTGY